MSTTNTFPIPVHVGYRAFFTTSRIAKSKTPLRPMAVGPKLILQVFEHHRRNFKRAELSALFEEPGAGPGLFAVKRIVDLHRGQLWTKSELGKGTTLYVSWPALDPPRPAARLT